MLGGAQPAGDRDKRCSRPLGLTVYPDPPIKHPWGSEPENRRVPGKVTIGACTFKPTPTALVCGFGATSSRLCSQKSLLAGWDARYQTWVSLMQGK